ncbi:MAG: glutamine synthetase type III, partial [Clostridia bacterium]|nr:glutamine synthetase type III [Clostridia bacterium]
NLLDPGKTPAENVQFLLILAAIIKAVDEYQDLIRLSVSYAGNDHRLGGGEAPPAIVSVFVGEELEEIINSIVDGTSYTGMRAAVMDLGIPTVPTFRKDTTDRNRTSPLAFTGNKFEFRMLGSSQNIALPNIVLNTTIAKEFKEFADILENAENFDLTVAKIIKDTFTEHRRIIFDGNGYSKEWEDEAEKRGLLNLDNSVDAYKTFTLPKNINLFKMFNVMSEVEIHSRTEILMENYSKIINIEALTMLEMVKRDIIPAVNEYITDVAGTASSKKAIVSDVDCSMEEDLIKTLSELNSASYKLAKELKAAIGEASSKHDNVERAEAYRDLVIPVMEILREKVDAMETMTATEHWPLPSYGDMLFNV